MPTATPRRDPAVNVHVPRNVPTPHALISPMRQDGTRISIELRGPVLRSGGMMYWIRWTLENRDGTPRLQWARQYSGRKVWSAEDDFRQMYAELSANRLPLPVAPELRDVPFATC